jgi:hypothetical protein
MNDDELLTAVRESFTSVRSATPAEQILSRGRAVRARRRIPAVAAGLGTAAAAAATAVAVSAALPASHPASHLAGGHPAIRPAARLVAWTVTRQPNGGIKVSFFHQLRDPARLQQTLRADGVPASVTFVGQSNPACHPYSGQSGSPGRPGPNGGPLTKVVGSPFDSRAQAQRHRQQAGLVIHPSALPAGTGLQIAVLRGSPSGPGGPWSTAKGSAQPVVEAFLVKASPQCTGS